MCQVKKYIKKTTIDFINESFPIHGTTYSYIYAVYVGAHIPVILICNICNNIFKVKPNKHLNLKRKQGCPNCTNNIKIKNLTLSQTEFIKRSENIHKDGYGNPLYDYSLVKYINMRTKVIITCKRCGIQFKQLPYAHLKGGCQNCANKISFNKSNTNEFIKKAILIHGDKYNYSLVIYINAISKVEIICNRCKEHFFQKPNKHLSEKNGCPICNNIGNVSEPKLYDFLSNNLNRSQIKRRFTTGWLNNKTCPQHLDFYLPDYNIAIEYQGIQHFKSLKFMGGEENFNKIKERDERKRLKCLENNCKLLYFTYTKKDVPVDYPHKVYTDEQELLTTINNIISP